MLEDHLRYVRGCFDIQVKEFIQEEQPLMTYMKLGVLFLLFKIVLTTEFVALA